MNANQLTEICERVAEMFAQANTGNGLQKVPAPSSRLKIFEQAVLDLQNSLASAAKSNNRRVEQARWVVDAYDQWRTGVDLKAYGSRVVLLTELIEELRLLLPPERQR